MGTRKSDMAINVEGEINRASNGEDGPYNFKKLETVIWCTDYTIVPDDMILVKIGDEEHIFNSALIDPEDVFRVESERAY